MTRPKDQLSALSGELLDEARRLQDLERRKRRQPISSPEFHRLAEDIERRARRVFRLAVDEERVGDAASRDGDTIDDVADRRSR